MGKNTLEMIFSIGESFFSVNQAKDLLEMIIDGAKQICDAERATLFLSQFSEDGDEDYLRSYIATDLGGQLQEIRLPTNRGIVGLTHRLKEAQIVNDVSQCSHFNPKIDELTKFETQSILSVPLLNSKNESLGVIQILNKKGGFDDEDLRKVKLLSLLSISALRKIQDEFEMKKMKKRIREYNQSHSRHMVWETQNLGLKKIYEKLKVVAKSNSAILLMGESGVGKEVMARLIHEQSDHGECPFISVQCAALPKENFEVELFGVKAHASSSFEEKEGLLQKAEGGTLFFDEISELPLDLQLKLVKALNDKKFTPVGSSEEIPLNVRILSASSRNLKDLVNHQLFREDLYFILNVFEFHVPAVRERIEDLQVLSEKLIEGICYEQNFNLKFLNDDGLEKLMSYDWPGNIRELKNVLERACVLAQGKDYISSLEILLPSDLPSIELQSDVIELRSEDDYREYFALESDMGSATKKFQKAYARKVIDACSGNKSQAAKDLKLSREGLRKILNREVA